MRPAASRHPGAVTIFVLESEVAHAYAPRMRIVDFTDERVDAAADLMARTYRSLREAEPHLPEALADTRLARERITPHDGGIGVCAIDSDDVVGFMVASRGSAYVRLPGHAARTEDQRPIYREMYAALAERLVVDAHIHHSVAVPVANPELLQTWFELGFGVDQIKGTRALDAIEYATPAVTVRRAGPDDLDGVAALSVELSFFHAATPMFKLPSGPFADLDEVRPVLGPDLSDPRKAIWIAVDDDRVVAMMHLEPDSTAACSVLIGMASTTAAARSRGVGTAVLAKALRWARDEGYERCRVGWTSANPISDRFWRSRGFRPVYYTLARRIDERAVRTVSRGARPERDS